MWYLYVLRCGDDSFYTGMTNDVARRLAEHQAGHGARYTRAHRPVALAGAWQFPDRAAAMRAEAAFKKLQRQVKQTYLDARTPFSGAPFAFDVLDDPYPHHFCPRCGGLLATRVSEGETVQVCTVCGRYHYRNAKPCAGTLILRDGRVLLVQRERDPYCGYWDIPGGFLQPDELPQAGAIREAREETGLAVAILDLLGFYLDNYDYQNERYPILNIYFVATAEGTPIAGDDAGDCAWFALDALPERIAFAHTPRVLADLVVWEAAR